MVASHIVPRYTIVVDVVQDRQAGFAGAVNVEFSIVRLTLFLVSRGRPWVVSPAVGSLVGWRHLFAIRGPEPSVEVLGFEIGTVLASLEITKSARRPNVRDVICKEEFKICKHNVRKYRLSKII